MLCAYPACFIKEENGYSVLFPDLDKATCGETLDEAMQMAVDCLAGVLYLMKKEGETPPPPTQPGETNLEEVLAEAYGEGEAPPISDAFVNMITVDVDEYAKRHFEKANLNFSQVLQQALKERLEMT